MNVLTKFSLYVQGRFGRHRLRRFLLGSIPFVFLLTLWQMNTTFEWLAPVFIPSIGGVIDAIFVLQSDCSGLVGVLSLDNSCLMTTHILSSIGRVLLASSSAFWRE
jgi:ABC-type nitrate/sulfonate/bicarbonate transport system permease component